MMTTNFKKIVVTICLFFYCSCLLFSQTNEGVIISNDNDTPDPSAIFEVKSSTKGMLIPRMSYFERMSILSPVKGLLIYQTDAFHTTENFYDGFWYWDGDEWTRISSASLWDEDNNGIFAMSNVGIIRSSANNSSLSIYTASNDFGMLINNDLSTLFSVRENGCVGINTDVSTNSNLTIETNKDYGLKIMNLTKSLLTVKNNGFVGINTLSHSGGYTGVSLSVQDNINDYTQIEIVNRLSGSTATQARSGLVLWSKNTSGEWYAGEMFMANGYYSNLNFRDRFVIRANKQALHKGIAISASTTNSTIQMIVDEENPINSTIIKMEISKDRVTINNLLHLEPMDPINLPTPTAGDIYYDINDNILKVWTNKGSSTAWHWESLYQ